MKLKPCHTPNLKHGAYMKNPKIYGVWITMMHRCYDEKRAKYRDYGGRGIKVCDEWKNPMAFVEWAEYNGYQNGLQLDRIDNNGNYCPENCRFVTPKENCRNRRNNQILTVNGESKCVAEWCEILQLNAYTVYWWIREKGKKYAEQRISEIA